MAAGLRILIADEHTMFGQGLAFLLARQPEVAEVGAVEAGATLAERLAEFRPDVLLLDLDNQRSVLAQVLAFAAAARVIVVSAGEQQEEMMLEALRAGARGIVFKRASVETLMKAVQAVMDGHVSLPPALQARLAARLREGADDPLTMRQREIVRMVALGLRNAEAARRLMIGEQTVKTHLNKIFRKLGVHDRRALVMYALRTGLIRIHDGQS